MEASSFFPGGYYSAGADEFSQEKREQKPGDHFMVEDLLDFPNDDEIMTDGFFDTVTGNSTDSSTVTVVDSCNSSLSGNEPHFSGDVGCRNFTDAQFSGELCVPCDELAELEWLSNFVEESFSSEDLHKIQVLSGIKAPLHTTESPEPQFQPETARNEPILQPPMNVPGKARSKRPRSVPCDWSTRLLVLSPATSSSESDAFKKPPKTTSSKKKENSDSAGDGRKCLHCAAEKTPQWRTGPMGPKTLCNACGVRFKSGRLVPEYRPAASPTFVSAKHSNSHRKVLELRRQKDLQRSHHHQFLSQTSIFSATNGDDYLIHHHAGPDFRHMI